MGSMPANGSSSKIKLGFGTTITDIDLRNLTPGLCYNLYNLYASRKLLIIKNQKLDQRKTIKIYDKIVN